MTRVTNEEKYYEPQNKKISWVTNESPARSDAKVDNFALCVRRHEQHNT